jgi:hypothetical protein
LHRSHLPLPALRSPLPIAAAVSLTTTKLALHIETEVAEQNKFLDGMNDTFENAGGHLADTMHALRRLSRSASGGHMCILVMFTAVFFFLSYLLLR